MNAKTFFLLLTLTASSAQASTVLQLGSNTAGFLTNLQNSAGSANQNLVWGLIVDTDGNGFRSSYDSGFSVSDTTSFPGGQFLSSSSSITGDRLFISSNLMTTGGTFDSSTGLAKPTNIVLSYSTEGAAGVLAAGGQQLAIIWFDYTTKTGQLASSGDKYGLFTFTFNTPADAGGGTIALASNFAGADPVRTASLSLAAVPEPSALLLTMVGALGLLRRRRH